MCVFCVSIQIFKRLFTMYADLRRLYGFCVPMCTTLRYVSGFAYVVRNFRTYVYKLALCKRLLRTYTALRTLYGFCALSGLCVRIRLLCFKRLVRTDTSFSYLQRLGNLFDIARMFVDSFDIAMTVVLDVRRFV